MCVCVRVCVCVLVTWFVQRRVRAAATGGFVGVFSARGAVCVRVWSSMVAAVAAKWGTLSVVVSNAGVNRRRTTALSDPAVWASVLQTNLVRAGAWAGRGAGGGRGKGGWDAGAGEGRGRGGGRDA